MKTSRGSKLSGLNVKRAIRWLDPDAKFQDYADRLGIRYQTLFNKFNNGNFTDDELDSIADKLGCEHVHVFKDKKTGKIFNLREPE